MAWCNTATRQFLKEPESSIETRARCNAALFSLVEYMYQGIASTGHRAYVLDACIGTLGRGWLAARKSQSAQYGRTVSGADACSLSDTDTLYSVVHTSP